MRFFDRADAGRRLADRLESYRGQDGLVLALPRGGVPVGVEIARALHWPLDLVIARKVGHPHNPEYAIAAVTESGEMATNPDEVAAVKPDWFEQAVAAERDEARRRRERYLDGRPPPPLEGRIAVVVDDGVATGLTVTAAVREVRARKPAKLVLAVPVIPADTARRLAPLVDDVVAVSIPEQFLGAVGAYYLDFHQTGDDEVVAALAGGAVESDG